MNDGTMIRVLTVDDHPLMMAGIAGEINAQPDMRRVAEATDGARASPPSESTGPDVTLMDIQIARNLQGTSMPFPRSGQEFPTARIVVPDDGRRDIHALRAFKSRSGGIPVEKYASRKT